MEIIKKILKYIIYPPPIFTVIFAIFGFGAVAIVLLFDIQMPILRYGSYLISAYALIISVAAVIKFFKVHPITGMIRKSAFGERYLSDVHFQNKISLTGGLIINLVYIIIKLISGIIYRSAWFIALAVYYILLAAMSFLLVRRLNARDELLEWRRYRLCGIMLFLMNQALAGIVTFVVQQNKGFDYPGFLIYAMAAYAFYAIITAGVNIFKARRHQSLVISAAKAINLVAATVSILSLETAMLSQFGGDDDPLFRQIMTGATGGAVCTIVIGMAIYMICRANKNIKKINNSKT